MKTYQSKLFYLLITICLLPIFTAHAYQLPDNATQAPEFIQYVDRPGNKALQVSVVRYKPRTGGEMAVDLVGAVHVADKQYYLDLNERFKTYDKVLYELVAPEGTQIPKGGVESAGVLSSIQMGMKDVLGLTFQMEEVDYTSQHFVHADFTPEEFKQSMDNKGESLFSMMFKLWRASLSQQLTGQAATNDFDFIMALMSADRQNALKTLVAKELASSDGVMSALEGPEGSTLIAERNKKALSVLRKEMAKEAKSFAIFYGAAHLADFHQRLVSDFDMVPVSIQWIDAWSLD